jgi:hypothetical protein
MKKFLFSAALLLCGAMPVWAGNVTTKLSGGTLFVYGDNGHNSLNIIPLGNGEIALVGYTSLEGEATTVNGKDEPVVLTKWTKGLYVYMYNGNDRVSIPYGTINGPVHIDLGNGNDGLSIGVPAEEDPGEEDEEDPSEEVVAAEVTFPNGYSTFITQTLFILGGSGQDSVAMAATSVGGKTTVDLGNDQDRFYAGSYGDFYGYYGYSGYGYYDYYAGPCLFKDSLLVLPGRGYDIVDLVGDDVQKDLTVDDSGDGLEFYAYGSRIGKNALIYGTTAADYVELYESAVGSLLKILTKDGNDSAYVTFSSAANIDIYAGSGNDSVYVYDCSTNKLAAFLENGNDFFGLYYSSIKTLLAYGGAGNDLFELGYNESNDAKVWGEAGTDTYRTDGNVFKKQNQYTIERREALVTPTSF